MKDRKLLITALSLILCLTVSIGLAVAYFTDYEAAKGGAVLHLSGQTEIVETVNDTGKTISISNTGESDMVVRVMVIGDSKKVTKITTGENWSGPDNDGWYYYTKVLKKNGEDGSSTSDINATITLDEKDDIRDFDVIVVHESERVVYDGNTVVIPDGWNVSSISAN